MVKTTLPPDLKHLEEQWNTHAPLEQEFARCASSPQYFATRYVYTFDETDKSSKLYPAYPYLIKKVIPEILKGGNAYWPKSQRMVITISFCMVDLWLWLFAKGENIYWTSRNERAVDNGGENSDWNSVAGKMRYMYDRLPTWLKTMALGKAYHSKFLWKKGSIRNLSNGNLITLEAPTSSAGVGIGVTRARVDEAASVVNMATIHVNLTDISFKVKFTPDHPNRTLLKTNIESLSNKEISEAGLLFFVPNLRIVRILFPMYFHLSEIIMSFLEM